MTTIGSYLAVATDLTRWRAVAAKAPDVAAETNYFKANIAKATSIDALLKDRRLFNYAMKAFGLGDRLYAVGMMRKVMAQGVANSGALANTLRDPNILAFAKAFDYAGKGAGVVSGRFAESVAGRYVEQAMQAQQGAQNPGVELALYFREQAPQLTSVYGALADKKLLQVVQTALDISPRTSTQPIDTQARLLKAKLNIDDFKDARKLDAFIARFAATYDMRSAGTTPAAVTNANAILYGASLADSDGPVGVDISLILRRQNALRGF
ncbi:DUF1217 domain-containing protein [Methylocystis parvus]|uniref:DUF1217 domain-containing protein n=1 Tax=Methylocystis parvus TaxID=134 RepID=A0A6B8M1H4_9HYPH|nr:DUF1217 domain-containing protein [Methylocystis parvus]QGM96188.1 DUF1217 domain-containing protein [Methylocystis parvus]WBJ99986.1 DUF1217 domain-containing protein [Methylocystis parvus OBBP]